MSPRAKLILPYCYFPPIGWWFQAIQHQSVLLDPFEFHIKQSYRNRAKIYAVNGTQNLTVVCDNDGSRNPMKETTLVDYEPWRKNHIKALESAYFGSPYFEFFEEDIRNIILSEQKNLVELNAASINWVNEVLDLDIQFESAEKFEKEYPEALDLRPGKKNEFIDPQSLPHYRQVFADKGKPFEANLSILDLIFNLGPEARLYLLNLI